MRLAVTLPHRLVDPRADGHGLVGEHGRLVGDADAGEIPVGIEARGALDPKTLDERFT